MLLACMLTTQHIFITVSKITMDPAIYGIEFWDHRSKMAQPQWITAAGSLGTIPEGIFYSVTVQAEADPGENVFYQVIAGELPTGIQVTSTGIIEGIPRTVTIVQGVPTEVAVDTVSKFAIRAYTTRVVNGATVVDRINDRTFTITVTGQDVPEFVTPAGNVGSFYDGTEVSVQIQFTDVDPAEYIKIRVLSGSLPPGLILNPRTGLISGVIAPLVGPAGTAPPGYDASLFDQYPFDFATRSASKNYQFSLEITDGKDSNVRVFEIYVYSKDSMSADTTDFTADNTFITADVVPTRTPVLLTPPVGSLGRIRTDNFYATKFTAIDFDGDPMQYLIDTAPPGLTLNSTTGWLYGYIPEQGATENTYDFSITVRKTDQPTIVSEPYDFEITYIGDLDTVVTWLTDPDLGTINNGSVSTLAVAAFNTIGRELQYQIVSGSNSRLPQGLTLLSTGDIAGTVSFNTFAVDQGTTTFDQDIRTRNITQETTFDMVFTFTVNAYAPGTDADVISVFRTFTITVVRAFNEPYQGLYIKCMPPQSDRDLILQLIQNQDIIPTDYVYRVGDTNFGVATSVIYNHAFGLNPVSIEEYVAALDINHYWKNLTLGKIEYAQARNANDEVIYEVVYSRVVDNLVNNAGESVGKSVKIPYPIGGPDSTEITTVYPNSLINMRDQVIDTVGQISPLLPAWMTSQQADGRVLGFVPAWVIAYVKPGQGARVVYNIREQFGDQLNQVDFKVDRYEIDRRATFAWEPYNDSTISGEWVPAPPAATTFDLTPSNIQWLNTSFAAVAWTNNSSNAVEWINPNVGTPTIFDGGATVFINPADTITNTDQYDKYLVFPRVNILG
jgi:hypothetical protein